MLVLFEIFFLTTISSASLYAGSKPNILVLFADDLGSGDLGVYGHPTIRTPNLDKLANEGVRFTQWYSGFHVCSPSRSSMMTGRIPIRIGTAGAAWTGGVFGKSALGGLPENETTLPEALKTAGYATGMIGKWHLGQQDQYLPCSNGFDTYFGIPYSVDMGCSAWRYDCRKWNFPPLPLMHNFTIVEQPVNLNTLSDRYVDFADKFISANTKSSTPWFFYYAFSHVHTPDFAGQKFCNTSRRGRFGDALESLDHATGKVMDILTKNKIHENTIIFFTSDNGPWLVRKLAGGSGGLLRDGKQTTWDGGVREPAFVRWTGKILPRISMEVATTYDIFPTALALAGVALPRKVFIDGRDISPLLFTLNATSPHECLFIYKGTPGLGCPDDHPNCPGLWAIRCGVYKIHWVTSATVMGANPNDGVFHTPPLIFNIEEDPSEQYPLDNTTKEWKDAETMFENARTKHLATLTPVPNQIAKGQNTDRAVCCDAHSKKTYPNYPNCTCNPENFPPNVFVCSPVGPTSAPVGPTNDFFNEFPDA